MYAYINAYKGTHFLFNTHIFLNKYQLLKKITIFNTLKIVDIQVLAKKLQKSGKNFQKK